MTPRVHLIGIACSSHDVLLAPYVLQSALSVIPGLSVTVGHYSHILDDEFQKRCAGVILDTFALPRPQFVGFSVYFWNKRACEYIAKHIKAADPEVTIIFGGPEMSADYINSDVDYIVVGEGEGKIIQIVGAEITGGNFHEPEIQFGSIPSPYLTGLIPDELLQRDGFKAVVETQRGCSFRCAYCQYHCNFPTPKYKDASDAVNEIEYAAKHGASAVRIADGNFLSRAKRATGIIKELTARGITIPLYMEFIASYCTDEFAGAIKAYGDVTVGIGLQSIDPDVLRLIRRPTDLTHVQKAWRLMAHAGALTSTDLILGLPGETRDSFLEGLAFVIEGTREGKHILHVSELLILPGTKMAELIQQHPPMPNEDYMYCARVTAAAYRVLNSSMRAWFYAHKSPWATLVELTGHIDLHGDVPEHYWNWEVFKDVTDEDLKGWIDG